MTNKNSVKRTSIGGQALIEGLMMKGPEKTCTAIRKPDGSIFTEVVGTKPNPVKKIPLVRGVYAMIQNFSEGYSRITQSAEIAMPDEIEEESKFDRWVEEKLGNQAVKIFSVFGMVAGVVLAVVLFMLLPVWIVSLIQIIPHVELGVFKSIVEGLIKIAIFIGYLGLVTRISDIHRVFEYHGAEHKTIACYEAGDALTEENVRKHSRFHPRCGTSFIFIVLLVSILVFSFVTWSSVLVRTALKLLLLPVVIGISYEVIMVASKHTNLFCRILSAPGLWIQRLTTFEPDSEEIEVAITAFNAVAPDDGKDLQ